ncbi:hypothetical protein [Kribbella sp. NPDC004536]|uniref:hypothetical protein n=1 Tax=Kribbella sp. NPDC004536 TaxID=3364106 RepID=UPI0036CDDBD1
MLNLVGELGTMDCTDERARRASGLNSADLAVAWCDLCQLGAVILDLHDGRTNGAVRLSTNAGTEYRARLRRVADPVTRAWTLRGALIDWLASGTSGFRCLAEFDRDPRSVLEGLRQAEHNELLETAQFLAGRGLVELIDTSASQLAKVKITADGHTLATRWQGKDKEDIVSAEDRRAFDQFVGGLRRLVTADDMPDERRREMIVLVDRLATAADAGDRQALRRYWKHARSPLQTAGPTLAYYLADTAVPPVLSD